VSEVLLIRVPVGDGADDVIEVQVSAAELAGLEESGVVLAAGDGRKLDVAAFSLASAIDHVMPALRMIAGRLHSGVHAPDEVMMQVGLQVGGEAGFYFAKGTTEASIAVTMTWRKPQREAAGTLGGEAPGTSRTQSADCPGPTVRLGSASRLTASTW
jgi:hypothetical protein